MAKRGSCLKLPIDFYTVSCYSVSGADKALFKGVFYTVADSIEMEANYGHLWFGRTHPALVHARPHARSGDRSDVTGDSRVDSARGRFRGAQSARGDNSVTQAVG